MFFLDPTFAPFAPSRDTRQVISEHQRRIRGQKFLALANATEPAFLAFPLFCMTTTDRRLLLEKLKSKKVGERRSAVTRMWKSGDESFAPFILAALQHEALDDPSIWQSKCLMIAAVGDLGFRGALPTLRALAKRDFRSAPLIYSEIAFAICRLAPTRKARMKFTAEALTSKQPLFARGVYQAVYYLDLELDEKEIPPLIRFANKYSKQHPDDEQLTCMPRDYLAAAAYRWPGKPVRTFLESCRATPFPHLQEIALASLAGNRSTDSRLAWYGQHGPSAV